MTVDNAFNVCSQNRYHWVNVSGSGLMSVRAHNKSQVTTQPLGITP